MVTKVDTPTAPKIFGKKARKKLFLHFKLTAYDDVELWCAMNYPERPTPATKYYRAWVIANDGPPKRRERMSPKRFKGSVFHVRCETVRRDFRGRELPPPLLYTVVREIVALEVQGKTT